MLIYFSWFLSLFHAIGIQARILYVGDFIQIMFDAGMRSDMIWLLSILVYK